MTKAKKKRDSETIRKFLEENYCGLNFLYQAIPLITNYILENNIIEDANEKYIMDLLKYYLRYSKGKNIYYFDTKKKIKKIKKLK